MTCLATLALFFGLLCSTPMEIFEQVRCRRQVQTFPRLFPQWVRERQVFCVAYHCLWP